MRTFQKVIKVMALCLAALIVVSLIGGLLGAFGLIGALVDDGYYNPGESSVVWEEENGAKVNNLRIETGATNLRIVLVDDIKKTSVKTNSEYISTWVEGDTLRVQEKTHSWFWFGSGKVDVSVLVPKDYVYDSIAIDSGAGTVIADELRAKTIDLELGAGRTKIHNIVATERAKIDGGAGLIEIEDGMLESLGLKLGAGKADLTIRVDGKNNHIETGVGRLELNLLGEAERYSFIVDKGIGAVTIDGKSQGDGDRYGNGDNQIELECGVGAVEVKLIDKNSIM